MQTAKNVRRILRAAELYYEENMSQKEIAWALECSVSSVSRFLIEARERGYVEIIIHREYEAVPKLSRALVEKFGLKDAVVIADTGIHAKNAEAVCKASAAFLSGHIRDDMTVAMNWGETISRVVDHFVPPEASGVQVAQMTGSLGRGNPEFDGPRPAFRLSEALGGTFFLVPAPAIVDSTETRDRLLQQPPVKDALKRASEADAAIMEIGAFGEGISSLERAGYLTADMVADLKSNGAVAHVLGEMINAKGEVVGPLGSRIVGLRPDALRNIPLTILVAHGANKAMATNAVLSNGYFNSVVVDQAIAQKILS